MSKTTGNPKRVFSLWNLRRYLRPYMPALGLAGLLMAIEAVMLLLTPWPLKFIVDNVIFRKPVPAWLVAHVPDAAAQPLILLEVLGIAMLCLGVADAALAYFGNRLLLRAGQRAIFDVRRDLFAHLQRLSLAFHRRQRTGDLMARLGGDIQTLQNLVVSVGTGVFAHFLTVAGMAAIMLAIDWRFALVVLAVAPLLLLLTRRYTSLLRQAFRRSRRKEGELWGKVQEILANVHVVQAYGREPHENARFTEHAEQSLGATIEASTLQGQLGPLVAVVLAFATATATWYGATRVLDGRITAGELLVFLAYLRGMASPIRQSAKMAGVVGKASIAAERLGDVFSEASEIVDPPRPLVPATCSGDISFRSVFFAYGGNEPVLRDISFHARPGQTVALVGATGAGKSTLVSLVPRFHDPCAGEVFLDGHDLRALPIAFVRSQVALVLQEALVFHGTLWENIAYGRTGAGREEAIAAARAVGIDDLIANMPQGYDTLVGERGATLSGGQRQCISIARAMLRNAPIVVLDEPTSGMDAVSEKRVLEALRRLTSGRTTLIIAHRLNTVVRADLILVLDNGRIVEAGKHKELLAKGGRYYELWNGGSHDAIGLPEDAPRNDFEEGDSTLPRTFVPGRSALA
jgi:ATP-binding cassette subfamily B protein/subfamily B ATP-binding cassette protein MsbA